MKKSTLPKPQFELWQTVYIWLKACGNKPSRTFCKEEITTHPDYPSLLSAIDLLDSGGMSFKAVQADASYIAEFNYPLLAHIKQPGEERMHIIENAGEWEKQKPITQHWSGITIFPEQNGTWQNEQNENYLRREVKNKILVVALSLTAIALLVNSMLQLPELFTNLFGLLSILGLATSIVALRTELGFQSELVKQVCGTFSKGGCEKVLKSSYAKGFAGITPADFAVLYFAVQFPYYLLACWHPSWFPALFLFALPGIGISAISIFIQAAKLKEWCILCLGIALTLTLQFAIFIIEYRGRINYKHPILFGGLFLALSIPYFFIKQLVKTNASNKRKSAELKKWKLDAGLFINLLRQEPRADVSIWKNDLLLGDPNAPLQITVACNPYCRPCAKAHVQLDSLMHRFSGKIKVQVRLLFPIEDTNNRLTIATKSILTKSFSIKHNGQLQEMLTDWFASMDFEKWSGKWKLETTDITERMNQHTQWIIENNITFTPTFFVNGRKMPGRYSLNDLEVLIPQLTEMIKASI
jgi:uncharacterized membrane protein